MKLTNFFTILLAVFFVMGVLISAHAGQKGVVVSPSAGGAKVETDTSKAASEKVKPGNVEPKAVPEKTKFAPKKKKDEIFLKSRRFESCNGKVVTILGTSGPDYINGTPRDDVIHGLGGADLIMGKGGNDTICGGDGNDKLYGYDMQYGGDGNDIIDGGKGNDLCINGPKGKGFLVNCENKKLPPTVGISPKTQRKPVGASGGFVPDKSAQKAQRKPVGASGGFVPDKSAQRTQLEKQKQFEAKKKAFVVQPDTMKPRSGDTSMGRSMSKPSSFVKFQTHLSVKLLSGDFTKWGTEWKDSSPEVLRFRWKTIKGTNEFSGKWQVSLLENFNTILFEGDAGTVPEPSEVYRWFSIDFTTWNHPIPVTYYVRVVPITESELYTPSSPVTISIIEPSGSTVFWEYPEITAAFTNPCCGLRPGTKLFLTGSDFGTKAGKILMCGDFPPNNCIELENIKWESDSKVNGVVPLIMQGRANQSVEVTVLTEAQPPYNYSNVWKMSFYGRSYCGEGDDFHIIYDVSGKPLKDCTPFRCESDNAGVYCKEMCEFTGHCAPGYRCFINAYCEKSCKSNGDCSPGLSCIRNLCVTPCETNKDCGSYYECVLGRCLHH